MTEVLEFIRTLNQQDLSYQYRLPSEDDWKAVANAAAKGGTTKESSAWCAVNSGMKTHKIATSRPTGLGIYDAVGNVHEWITVAEASDKFGVRGGAFSSSDTQCSWDFIDRDANPDLETASTGFRLARIRRVK